MHRRSVARRIWQSLRRRRHRVNTQTIPSIGTTDYSYTSSSDTWTESGGRSRRRCFLISYSRKNLSSCVTVLQYFLPYTKFTNIPHVIFSSATTVNIHPGSDNSPLLLAPPARQSLRTTTAHSDSSCG